jgi:tetratricopeptide (TPR) repeat protein
MCGLAILRKYPRIQGKPGDDAQTAKNAVIKPAISNFRVDSKQEAQVHRIFRILSGTAMLAALGLAPLVGPTQADKPATPQQAPAQQGPQKNWKDAAEYDMYSAVVKETDPKKKIALLNAWKDKYPATDYKTERLQLYLQAYQQAGDLHKLVDTLNEMLTLNPKDVVAMGAIMYYVMLPAYEQTPSAGTLDNAEKVANSALANLDNKPPTVKDEDWVKARKQLEALAHQTLGWVAMNRKDSATAETEFLKSLQVDPNQGQVDYWLAGVLRGDKTPEKVSQALFYYARAATYDGPGSLTPDGRKQLDDYLHKAWASYHGPDEAGLDQLKTLAKSQPTPPPDFKVKTAQEIAIEKEEEFKKTNPQLALWMGVKKQLTAPDGTQYFEGQMKGTLVQGLKGTIISAKPAVRSKELIVGVADPNTPEVTLKLDAPLTGKPDLGEQIEFEGVPTAFTPDPFMVTFDVEKAKIKGLSVKPAGPVSTKKRTIGKKKS